MNYIIDSVEFGLALMNARRRKEISQKDAAHKLEMCATTLSKIERGRMVPNSKVQKKLVKLFPEVFE